MEIKLQNNVMFFFIGVLLITLLGFYPTYFIHFPTFTGFSWVHHFHAFIASLWICMLIAQAFLIRAKKYSIHRMVGKASYLVMPVLLFSFFLMAKAMYYKNIDVKHLSEADALADLSRSGLPDIFYLSILYGLGIIYKRKTSWHLRFFTCTGLMILGPGLGRMAFMNFPPQVAGPIMGVVFLLVPLVWLIIDIVKKKSPVPLLIFIAISLTAANVSSSGHAAWWQAFAGWVKNTLF
jgi:hypothetical protein